jgi:osmotically-inducible protein OsmY
MQYLSRPWMAAMVAAALALSAGPAAADRDDAVSARVRQALVAAGLRDAAGIQVTTFNGAVELSGVVRSDDAKQQAARVTGLVRGVTAVRNSLEVQEPGTPPDTDAVLANRVKAALIAAGIPGARAFEVTAFNGDVELSGVVGSDDGRDAAARVTGAVEGVGAVRNDLVVPQP